jgi:YidC/Oxa1 family membrane protein insertase
MAGCLPVFLQIPIFIGLYRAVSIDIKLRQQPLLPGVPWCSNLAGPDQLLDWSHWMPDFIAGMGTGWFGPFLNILPLVTVTLFVIQQKVLMPKATDEQMQMQQTMMMYMTLFMGVLFFKVPAGLCIYFITSSLWSLVERQLVKRTIPPIQPGKANTEATTQANQADRSYTPREKKRPKAPKPPEKLSDVLPWLRDKKK